MSIKNVQSRGSIGKMTNGEKTYSEIDDLVKTPLMGIGVTNATETKILEYISNILLNSQKNIYIVTPNPEIVMLSIRNTSVRHAINTANLALIDGVGLVWAGKILGAPLRERVIGTNFMETLCKRAVDWPITVGFLGGGPNVAVRVSECLRKQMPGLHVGYASEEWDDSLSQKPVDILFVAFGAPKQELWMQDHINKIPVRVMMGVGGAFDQILIPSLRPPQILSLIGFGWLYRLIRQPWRIIRQFSLLLFAFLVFKEKLSAKS